MEQALTSVDAFRAYLDDVSEVTKELFRAVVKKGDIHMLEVLLTRDICISKDMFNQIQEGVIKDMVHAYRRIWGVYYLCTTCGVEIDRDDYEGIDFNRVIEGKTLNEYIRESVPIDNIDYSSDDVDDDVGDVDDVDDDVFYFGFRPNTPSNAQPQQDEAKMQDNGRLRIYQRRKGSLYCGLYAIQHVLNSVDDVQQEDLDELSLHVIDDIELSAEEKKEITLQDHEDPNGNYSIETLCQALENAGYVALSNHRTYPDINLLQDMNVVGVIANRSRSHWFAFRRVEDQWEECDSLASGAFPIRTSQQVATRVFEAYIAVIRPTPLPESIDWVGQRQRLAQLLEMVKRNQ